MIPKSVSDNLPYRLRKPSRWRNRTHRPSSGPVNAVLEQEVRLAAYELYERRGGTPDHAVEDWLTAEAHLAAAGSRTVGS